MAGRLSRVFILVVNPENVARLLVGNEYLKVFEILLDDSPSASINPLCLYTPQKYLNVVELLFPNVKIRFKYKKTNTITRLAVDKMNLKFIKRLLEYGEVYLEFGYHAFFGSHNGTLLHMAMFNNSHHLARLMIRYGADVHRFVSSPWESTLHLAAIFGSPLIQEVIDRGRGVSVDVMDCRGTSPLYYASTAKVAEILLQNGANVEGVSKGRHTTALLRAVEGGNIRLVKTLLLCGADIQCKDHSSRSILDLAYGKDKTDLLKFLLEYCFSGTHTILKYPLLEFYQFIGKESNRLGRDSISISHCFLVAAYHLARLAILIEHILSYQGITSSFFRNGLTKNVYEEHVKMSKQKVGGTEISFGDILKKSPGRIASLLRNEAFSDDVRSQDLEARFPAYGTILKYQFERGRHRKNIQEEAVKICSRLFSNFKCLPDEVQGIIIGHLSTQDVMILKRICMPLKT